MLKALNQIHYKAPATERELIYEHLEQHLFQAYRCLHLLQLLEQADEQMELLRRAIGYKLRNIRKRVFAILTFLYDSEVLLKASVAMDSGQKEKRANALEMLDNLVEKRVQPRLFPFL